MGQISHPDDLQRYYQDESVARDYVAERFRLPKNLYLHQEQVRLTNAILRRRQSYAVLELACGPGRLTRDINLPGRGVAVDASEQMLALARRHTADRAWEFHLADIFALDLGERFDTLFSFRFIRHFDRQGRQRIYEVVHRHLAAGGALVFDAPNLVVEGPFRARHPDLYPIFDELWTEQALREELQAAGFARVCLHPRLCRHGAQRAISFATKRGLNELGARLIRWLDGIAGGEPLEWIVHCER